MNLIPKKIHLVYLTKNEIYPILFSQCIQRVKDLHPDWEIQIYDEDDATKLINENFPSLWPIYSKFTHLVQKADFFRVVLIHLFGGFYLDMDIYCLKPLDDLRIYEVVLGEEKTLSNKMSKQLNLKHSMRIANYMFGSAPKHEFWLFLLRNIIKKAAQKIDSENDILNTTGPGIFTDSYFKGKKYFPKIVLLVNKDRKCLCSDHDEISCHFGNYAAHLHHGTWRWGQAESSFKTISKQTDFAFKSEANLINRKLSRIKYGKFSLKIAKSNFSYSNVGMLYKTVDSLERSGFSKKISLVLDTPLSVKNFESDGMRYVLFIANDRKIATQEIKLINVAFESVIVVSEVFQKSLIATGVKKPVFVVNQGFPRFKRNLYDDVKSPFFTVSFTVTPGNKVFYEAVREAFEELADSEIVNLRLKLSSEYYKSNELEINSYNNSILSKPFKSAHSVYNWYKDVHCILHLGKDIESSFIPYFSLYMGTPVLTALDFLDANLRNLSYVNLIHSRTNNHNCLGLYNKEEIKKGIISIYKGYNDAQRKALEGSAWIEDKWRLDEMLLQIVDVLNNIR